MKDLEDSVIELHKRLEEEKIYESNPNLAFYVGKIMGHLARVKEETSENKTTQFQLVGKYLAKNNDSIFQQCLKAIAAGR